MTRSVPSGFSLGQKMPGRPGSLRLMVIVSPVNEHGTRSRAQFIAVVSSVFISI